jgi:hypothetical protein
VSRATVRTARSGTPHAPRTRRRRPL